ncbi:MAG: 4-alpha-glucanotransferase [Gammaproteobacteria bacterium]
MLKQRRAGVLLHITSLPGSQKFGDLGHEAFKFIDFLREAGISVWQTLPLGMPHDDGSPYQCLSAHAGNPALISRDKLVEKKWLDDSAKFSVNSLDMAFAGFLLHAEIQEREDFEQFCKQKAWWLDDFALFVALRSQYGKKSWSKWPEDLKNRDKNALKEVERRLAKRIKKIKFEQFIFSQQWKELKDYAHQNRVMLFGDIPIFVSYESADVWAQRDNFKLDKKGQMTVVAGVPPDYFSETGQRWGNPHFDWTHLKKDGFKWWIDRIRTQAELFDLIRIDHFRGLEAAWEIPAKEKTAVVGQWVQAPGKSLLKKIKDELGAIPLIAEDLGVITPEVEMLRDHYHLPGMKILQFAFSGGCQNPYLPHNFTNNFVAYTGTHDNDTTLGWYHSLSDIERDYVHDYLGCSPNSMPGSLIKAVMASIANMAIVPMQDILNLGTEHRMNTPGTMEGNWKWRFRWDQLTNEMASRIAHWVGMYGRRIE